MSEKSDIKNEADKMLQKPKIIKFVGAALEQYPAFDEEDEEF